MPIKTLCGNEEILEIIVEIRHDFMKLKGSDRDIILGQHSQDWSKYFVLLRGPVYPNLVKAFWKYALESEDGNSIHSFVYDIPFTITPSSIARAIGCTLAGVTVDEFRLNYTFIESFRDIFNMSFLRFEPNNPDRLSPTAKAWFNLLLNNF